MSNTTTVYSSNQYQILTDLSALLTAAMMDSVFSRTVEQSLSTKINRDQQFIFFTPKVSENYYTSISAAGIEIVGQKIQKPTISLTFKQQTEYTYDKLSQAFYECNISGYPAYARHYVSGTLPTLTFNLTEEVPSISILQNVISNHDIYSGAHQNLQKLQYYYNKTDIDIKEDAIKNTITVVEQNLFNAVNDNLATMNNNLIAHNNDNRSHKYLDGLVNYCPLSTHNNAVTYLNNEIVTHNTSVNAHQDIRNLITQNETNINDFKVQYSKDHTGNKQISFHDKLMPKEDPQTTTNYIIVNSDIKKYDDTYITLNNKNNNNNQISLTCKLTDNQYAYFDNHSSNNPGPIVFRQFNMNNNLLYSATLLDKNGDTTLNNLTADSVKVSYPSSENNSVVPTIQWVKDYLKAYISEIDTYRPYDAMPDYANAYTIGSGKGRYYYKS